VCSVVELRVLSRLVLVVAGPFEIPWAAGPEHSDGFTGAIPTDARRLCISVIAFAIVGLHLVSGGH